MLDLKFKSSNVITKLQKSNFDKTAFVFLANGQEETARITYGQLDASARAIAAFLQSKNLFGERVLLLFPAGVEFISAFMGCLYAGVIAVPVNCPRVEEFAKAAPLLNVIAKDADVAGILAPEAYSNEFLTHCEAVFATKEVFFQDPLKLLLRSDLSYQAVKITDATIAYLQYTSGSTSAPKGAVVRHKNLTHSLKYTAKIWRYGKNSKTCVWAPHSHVYGLVCGLLVPIFSGTSCVIMPVDAFIRRPLSWLEVISEYGITHSGCPNFGYGICTRDIAEEDLEKLNLNSWEVAINGGDSVQYETLTQFSKKFADFGFRARCFNSTYGMSEVTGAIATGKFNEGPSIFNLDVDALRNNNAVFTRHDVPHRKMVGNGFLLPGLDAVAVDTDKFTALPETKVGEIWLRGEAVVSEYWRRPEESVQTFGAKLKDSNELYFRTGDLGFIYQGEICLTGRLKEVLVVYGKKYYPLDLETTVASALQSFPVTNYRVAFSIPLSDKEEVLLAQEINEGTAEAVQEEIIHSIRRAIASRFGIDLYAVVLLSANAIPRTGSGKLQRKVLQQDYLANTLTIIKEYKRGQRAQGQSVAVTDTQDGLAQKFQVDFVKLMADVLNLSLTQININASLSEYGFDSVNIIKLTNQLTEKFKLVLTPAKLFEYTTLNDFFQDLLSQQTKVLQGYYHASGYKPENSTHKNLLHVTRKTIPEKPAPVSPTDIAIVGMSGVFPGATNLTEFWANLLAGKDAITEIPATRWRWQDYAGDGAGQTNIHWGGFIDGIDEFDANFFNISPREAELMDPQQRLFLQQVWKAVESAGYAIADVASKKTGLFVGVFSNDYAEILQSANITDAYTTTGLARSMLANRVSYLLNFQGPSEVIDTACSSSLVAVHHAVKALHNNDCEIAIVGGVNALLTPTSYIAASKAGMLSADGSCKTFDKDANGYVRAEGVGVLVLKPLTKALVEGDNIRGVIKGTAVNHGGHVSSLTVPNPNAQSDVVVTAIQRAQVPPETITYIETHGTGTPLGDPVEINGLKKAFNQLGSESRHSCALGSVKTNVGHLESAAGMAGIIKVLLALEHHTLPANLHFKTLNPYIEIENSPFYLLEKAQKWINPAANGKPLRAGVSSFGFGGTNAHIILEELVKPQPQIHATEQPLLITLSAKTLLALKQRVLDLQDWITVQSTAPDLSALAFTLNQGRDHFNFRCAFVVNSVSELLWVLAALLQDEPHENYVVNATGLSQAVKSSAFHQLFKQALDEIHKPYTAAVFREKLLTLGSFYVEGYELDWTRMPAMKVNRLSLPTYPFAKQRHWLTEIKRASADKPTPSYFAPAPARDIQNYLINTAASLLKIPAKDINVETGLTELGFDSISYKELAAALEKDFALQTTPAIFYTHKTIAELNRYFSPNLPQERESKAAEILSAQEPIAIIGMYGMLPQSRDLMDFWQHLLAGDDLVTEVPSERWDWREYFGDAKQDAFKTNSKWGAFIADADKFDASFFKISAREANLMDPQHRVYMEVVWKTIEDAGYDPLSFSKQSLGIFAGVEFSEYQTLIHAQKNQFHGHVATGNSHAMLANRISYFLDLRGPSEVVDTACSSSLVAINRAVSAIRHGECTMAVAGGVSLMLNPETFVITSQLGALSADGRCKTFDKSANGYVKGEGAAALFLKPLRQAQRDGDDIYGVIRATQVNHGGKAQSLTAPDASAQSELLVKAYQQAGVDPATITYIETHGTGTELGDPIEIEGLKHAFQTLLPQEVTKPFCGLGALKTNIGHLEPASGVAGVVKVLLAMRHSVLPGILHLQNINPFIDLKNSPFYLVENNQPWERLTHSNGEIIPHRAGVSSFGFGGANAHVVLEEAPQVTIQMRTKPAYLLTFSAKQSQSLQQKFIELSAWLERQTKAVDLASLGFSLNVGRSHFEERAALVVTSLAQLKQMLIELSADRIPENCLRKTASINKHASPVLTEIYQSAMQAINAESSLSVNQYSEKLLLLADLFVNNYPLDWQQFYANEAPRRIAGLPGYPFIKQSHWFDQEISQHSAAVPAPQAPAFNLQEFTIAFLQKIFAEKLKLQPTHIAAHETYEVYGVDSLLGLEITNLLEETFGTLARTLLYERSSLNDLAKYFQQKHAATLEKLFKQQNPQTVMPLTTAPAKVVSLMATPVKRGVVKDIAIIGLQGTYPQAQDLDEFWDNLVAGKNCVGEVPAERWDYRDYPVKVGDTVKYFKDGGFIPDIDKFDPLFFNIAPRDAALMDPQERLFMQACWSVLEDAGYTRESLQKTVNNSVGVFAGVTYNFYPLFIAEEWFKGNRIPLDIQNFSIANRVSYFLNLNGPSFVIDTACSSSLAAIHQACESIQQGECKMAIAGGVNLTLHPCKYHMLGSYSFMSEEGRCASFAANGAGYVPSEGLGTVLLKPLADAIRDNDRIYGVIKGTSMNHGGKTSGYTVPNPNAQAELIKTALSKANINPRTISYIEAHGTGTALGDPIEVRGLQEAFEEYTHDKQFCAIGSVKSNIGHLESAAGISQLTKVLLQMRHKTLVPSIHAEVLNPFIDFPDTPFYVQRELSDWTVAANQPRRSGISSFGAGGTNVHVIVEEYVAPSEELGIVQTPFVFVLSALNKDRLIEYAANLQTFLLKNAGASLQWLQGMCFTLQTGREAMSTRMGCVVNSIADLVQLLTEFLAQPEAVFKNLWINTNAQTKTTIQSTDAMTITPLWVNGGSVDWGTLYSGQMPQRISLPTYPFAKRRCWVPTTEASVSTTAVIASAVTESTWVNRNLNEVGNNQQSKHWLIFSDKELSFHLQNALGKENCTWCFVGEDFQQSGDNVYYVSPEMPSAMNQVVESVYSRHGSDVAGFIYLWPCQNMLALMNTFKALITKKLTQKLLFALITRQNQAVTAQDAPSSIQSSTWAMTRAFAVENANFDTLLIDLGEAQSYALEALTIAKELTYFSATDNLVAWRGTQRFVTGMPACVLKDAPPAQSIKQVLTAKLNNEALITREHALALILNSVSSLLDLEVAEIQPDVPFQNYGMDSIIGINFIAEINTHFPDALSPMDLYRYPSIGQLADYLVELSTPVSAQTQEDIPDPAMQNEEQFIQETANLSVDQLNAMLAAELLELDNLI
jgi:polyketide synthase PksL